MAGTVGAFAPSQLKPVSVDPTIFGQEAQDAAEHYEINEILDKKVVDGETLYLTSFKGYDKSYDLWLPLQNFDDHECIDKFERSRAKRAKAKQSAAARRSAPSRKSSRAKI